MFITFHVKHCPTRAHTRTHAHAYARTYARNARLRINIRSDFLIFARLTPEKARIYATLCA